jgi:hypothetical protein
LIGALFKPKAWIEVQATVLMMSATVQPLLKSLTGLVSPCMTGPIAMAPVDCCTACTHTCVMVSTCSQVCMYSMVFTSYILYVWTGNIDMQAGF